MEKYVYNFAEGNKDMNNILGGKGANLAEMTALGLPVPEGFTISTVACNLYYEKNGILPPVVVVQILNAVHELERQVGKVLGDKNNPLLVSVRSGAPISMPGMMDTVLNLGLNDEIVLNLAKTNERFAYDSYRRLIQMYADVVKGYPNSAFEKILDEKKQAKKVKSDHDLDAKDLIEITNSFKKIYKDFEKEDFPQDPKVQLIEAVTAVFRSWNNDRAIYYRKMNNISANLGTAVNVQRMVYGNKGENCGTGVAFTRNPASGENKLYGEYLMNAQGEDVVAGIRTPKKIASYLRRI